MRIRVLLLLLLPAAAAAADGPYRFEDPFWNLVYAPAGLRKLIAPSDPLTLFKGRAAGDVYVELKVHEGAKADDVLEAVVAAAKAENARPGKDPSEPLFYTVRKHRVFEEVHGHRLYGRGVHLFEVHAWVTDRSASSEKDIGAALAALTLGDDPGCGIRARQVALLHGREQLDPEVLLEAGRQYLGEGQPALAAGLLKRARAVRKPGALKKEDEAALLLLGGLAQIEAGAPKDAVPWLRDAETAAEGEKAREAAYHLARAAAAAGMLDDAFAQADGGRPPAGEAVGGPAAVTGSSCSTRACGLSCNAAPSCGRAQAFSGHLGLPSKRARILTGHRPSGGGRFTASPS